MAIRLVQLSPNRRKVVLWGKPKSSKSTIALSATQPVLDLNYDGGTPGAPPGVDPENVWIQNYPPNNADLLKKIGARSANIGDAIVADIEAVVTAFVRQQKTVTLPDIFTGEQTQIPIPATLILDGGTDMVAHILNAILAKDGKQQATDYSNKYELWTKRKDIMQAIGSKVFPLPCNIIFTCWSVYNEELKEVTPDIGGVLDTMFPGKVDASLYCYTEGGRFWVRTKPTGPIASVGIRGRYDVPDKIDMTIDKNDMSLPWDRIWKSPVELQEKVSPLSSLQVVKK